MEREEFLENLIKQKGYSLRSFAEKCGIPYTSLYTMLKRTGIGKSSVDNVIVICQNLGIKVEELEKLADGSKVNAEPNYDDVEQLIARNGKQMSKDQKLRLIQLLSEIDLDD